MPSPQKPDEHPDQRPLEHGWAVLMRRKWVVLQALIIIPVAVLAITLTQSDRYTATATLLFQDPTLGVIEGQGSGFVDPDRAAATNADLATLPVVAERAAETLGVAPDTVLERVEVDSSSSSDIAEIEATADLPDVAADTATAYAEAYIEFRRDSNREQLDGAIAQIEGALAALAAPDRVGEQGAELRDRLDRLRLARSLQTGNAELVQPADPPSERSSPNVRQSMMLGFVLAIAVAFALATLLERIDRAVRDVDELERLYGLPALARIPRSKALARSARDFADLAGRSSEAEAFRTLRANLGYFNVDGGVRSVLVASPLAGDGKSTVASFLAMTMASMGDSVVLVDTDLHKGDGRAGLSSVLAGTALDDAIREIDLPFVDGTGRRTLQVVEAGPPPPNPYELLESERMAGVLDELEARFDLVLLDSPALSAVSDGLALVPRVSGVLIVSALGHTTRDSALDLRKQLALVQGRPLGVVANLTTPERGGYYYAVPSAPIAGA